MEVIQRKKICPIRFDGKDFKVHLKNVEMQVSINSKFINITNFPEEDFEKLKGIENRISFLMKAKCIFLRHKTLQAKNDFKTKFWKKFKFTPFPRFAPDYQCYRYGRWAAGPSPNMKMLGEVVLIIKHVSKETKFVTCCVDELLMKQELIENDPEEIEKEYEASWENHVDLKH